MTSRARSLATAIRRSPVLNAIISAPTNTTAFAEAITVASGGAVGAGGSESFATAADLPLSGNEVGDFAFVQETNRLYLWNGQGWYNIALINNPPVITSPLQADYTLSKDGTPTIIELTGLDSDGTPGLIWSYEIIGGSESLGNIATITQNDNTFTITPSVNEADAGSFQITFSLSDGISTTNTITSTFRLAFTPPSSGVLYKTPGTYDWVVPEGIESISCVVIGGGGSGASAGDGKGGGGGSGAGLTWANNIPVTAGETLTIVVGAGGQSAFGGNNSNSSGYNGGASIIKRNTTTLVQAYNGIGGVIVGNGVLQFVSGGYGGRSSDVHNTITSYGGGRGGSGEAYHSGSSSTSAGGAGGAGGYLGDGGGTGTPQQNAVAGSGGGRSGDRYSNFNGNAYGGNGGGVGVYGLGDTGDTVSGRNGAAGSGGDGIDPNAVVYTRFYGGGGAGAGHTYGTWGSPTGGDGAVRIIWGDNRTFPSTNVDLASSEIEETII